MVSSSIVLFAPEAQRSRRKCVFTVVPALASSSSCSSARCATSRPGSLLGSFFIYGVCLEFLRQVFGTGEAEEENKRVT